jgi:hypothetical protein
MRFSLRFIRYLSILKDAGCGSQGSKRIISGSRRWVSTDCRRWTVFCSKRTVCLAGFSKRRFTPLVRTNPNPERRLLYIASLLFHVARWTDVDLGKFDGGEQVWQAQRLAEAWGIDEPLLGRAGAGTGMDDAAPASLVLPIREVLVDDAKATFEAYGAYLETDKPANVDQSLAAIPLIHDNRHLGMVEALAWSHRPARERHGPTPRGSTLPATFQPRTSAGPSSPTARGPTRSSSLSLEYERDEGGRSRHLRQGPDAIPLDVPPAVRAKGPLDPGYGFPSDVS